MKNIKYLLSLVIVLLSVTSCTKDFLDRPPLDHLTVSQYFKSDADLKTATSPLYGILWYDYNIMFNLEYGEGMSGNIQSLTEFEFFNADASNDMLTGAWSALYKIIDNANYVIYNVNTFSGPTVSEEAKTTTIGEARMFRAIAYSYLIHIWGKGVPIIDDPMELVSKPNKKRVVPEDVYAYLFNDLYYAKNYLPESWAGTDLGRFTRYSAEAYLAKMYLHYSGYNATAGNRATSGFGLDSAKYYAKDVILNSGAALVPNYADVFKREFNNNSESLIALQYTSNFGNSWGAQNTRQAFIAAEGRITGAGDGWGRFFGASESLLKLFREDSLDLRRKAVFMMVGDTFPEILKDEGGYVYPFEDKCDIKKYVIGTAADNDGHVGFMSTDLCYYIMRLPEVYLIYAEAILGNNNSTSDPDALLYFNLVRQRAGLSDKTSITFKDIFNEKRKEFALEDQLMFEYVRWFYFEPDAAMAELQDQHRPSGLLSGFNTTLLGPNHYAFEFLHDNDQAYTVDAEHMFLPYPELEVIEDPDLQADPVHYPY